MDKESILERLESFHEVVSKRKHTGNKLHWLDLSFNKIYQNVKKDHQKFLILKGRSLEATNKLLAFFPFIVNEKRQSIEGHYLAHCYMQQAITCMFYEPIVSLSLNHKDLTIADIILKDDFKYELSINGAKQWFDRNYPRTFGEIGVTNMGIKDGKDEWPTLRCHLYSYGCYDEVRVWEDNY